jgi:thiol-disulfide isomerase/thioredoxin
MKGNYMDKLNKMCIGNKIVLGVLLLFVLYCLFWRSTTIVKIVPYEKMENPKDLQQYNDVPTFVMYKANWCGHCQKAKPEWEKALNENKTKIKMVAIDGDQFKDLVKQKNITGFPTILYYGNGLNKEHTDEYNGPRTSSGFLSFLNSKK